MRRSKARAGLLLLISVDLCPSVVSGRSAWRTGVLRHKILRREGQHPLRGDGFVYLEDGDCRGERGLAGAIQRRAVTHGGEEVLEVRLVDRLVERDRNVPGRELRRLAYV